VSRVWLFSLLLASGLVGAVGIDPTQPPTNLRPLAAEAGRVQAVLALQGILRGARGSRAVIDGAALRVGDEYAGARVLTIYPQSVLIEHQGQRQLLRLADPVMQPSR